MPRVNAVWVALQQVVSHDRVAIASRAPERCGDGVRKVLLALIGEAQHDPEMARTFHRRYLDPQRRSEREMLTRGIANGELSDELEIDAALDALCGPIVYRALTGAPIPRRFIDTLIADTLKRTSPHRPVPRA